MADRIASSAASLNVSANIDRMDATRGAAWWAVNWYISGYGIGLTTSATGVASARNGAKARSPSATLPVQHTRIDSTSSPTRSCGTYGAGGACSRLAIVVRFSGAAAM